MYGCLVGDIVGSSFEFSGPVAWDFPFFAPGSSFTDDSVMTLAVAKAAMGAFLSWQGEFCLPGEEGFSRESSGVSDSSAFGPFDASFYRQFSASVFKEMRKLGRAYPQAGYGRRFLAWLESPAPRPYQSYGNGAAMRVSPLAYLARSEGELRRLVTLTTELTHDHPEGRKGALTTARVIYRLRTGASRDEIRFFVEGVYGAFLSSYQALREGYQPSVIC